MARLGYPRYGAQGGDWGSQVTTALSVRHPEHLIGIHLNMVFAFPDPEDDDELTEREREALAALQYHRRRGSGYAIEQSTRPQSLGYGLVDPPAGLPAGSSRSSGRGATATVIRPTSSPVTRCWTTSCSTGCPAPAQLRPGCTGRASANASRTPFCAGRCLRFP